MKASRILYFISIILFSFPLQAQEDDDAPIPFSVIEKQPRCLYTDDKGDTIEIPLKECLDSWVLEYIDYPEEALKKKIQGRVILTLKIDKKGILSIEKAEGDPILEKAAREVFEGFPQLAPAEQRGKPVVTFYQYPISFRTD